MATRSARRKSRHWPLRCRGSMARFRLLCRRQFLAGQGTSRTSSHIHSWTPQAQAQAIGAVGVAMNRGLAWLADSAMESAGQRDVPRSWGPGSRTLRARTPALSRACLASATGRSSSGRSGPPASTSDRVPAACRTRRRPSGSSREQRFSARRSVVQRVAWSVASRIRVLPNQCSKPRGLNDVRDGDERVVARRSP